MEQIQKGGLDMEDKELRELKREINIRIEGVRQENEMFKKRVSVIFNLFLPGIGHFIYGSSYIKGIITFLLFLSYNIIFFNVILPNIDTRIAIIIIYYLPAIVIWMISLIMVSSLER